MLKDHREIDLAAGLSAVHPRHRGRPRGLIELKDAAMEGVEEDRPLERSHRLAAAVADAIAYAPGATDAHTTAAEALEQGRGVCQDLAHAMIAVAHAAGIPARYVTGYLLTGDEERARRRMPGPSSSWASSAGSASTRPTAAARTSATSASAPGATPATRRRSAGSRAAAAARLWM